MHLHCSSQQAFWLVIVAGTAQVLLITLTMALFSLSVPLDVLTVSQHEQYAETEAAKRNSLIQFIIYTSAFITASKMSLTKKAHTLK